MRGAPPTPDWGVPVGRYAAAGEVGAPGSSPGRVSGVDQEVSVAKEDRGFASMDRVKQREIASKGGKAAHQKGTAHEWTSEEAREAGRKGGMASHRRRKEMMDPQGGGTSPSSMESMYTTERAGGDDQSEQIR